MKKASFQVRIRAFKIWQKNGFLPWSKKKEKTRKKDFYEGAFDDIPFLNDDAKRTFVHLLLRPGYMIRDYIHGQHERYLAPLTSLIIFYAFFALVAAIVNPEFSVTREAATETPEQIIPSVQIETASVQDPAELAKIEKRQRFIRDINTYVPLLIHIFDLDKHPELVDTPVKASLAALEGSLRSRGVYLFLGQFLFLWVTMILILKKRGMGASACAAIAAYVLCQFCFFMFFSLFFSSKEQGEIGVGLMAILLTVDYRQLFGLGWKKSIRLTLKTGLFYVLAALAIALLLVGIVLLVYFLFYN